MGQRRPSFSSSSLISHPVLLATWVCQQPPHYLPLDDRLVLPRSTATILFSFAILFWPHIIFWVPLLLSTIQYSIEFSRSHTSSLLSTPPGPPTLVRAHTHILPLVPVCSFCICSNDKQTHSKLRYTLSNQPHSRLPAASFSTVWPHCCALRLRIVSFPSYEGQPVPSRCIPYGFYRCH